MVERSDLLYPFEERSDEIRVSAYGLNIGYSMAYGLPMVFASHTRSREGQLVGGGLKGGGTSPLTTPQYWRTRKC